MNVQHAWYAVDRLEGDLLVLIDDDGRQVEQPVRTIPFRVKEGMVLRVPLDAQGQPDWRHAVRDEEERQRRLDEARARLERLRGQDPGGDVRL